MGCPYFRCQSADNRAVTCPNKWLAQVPHADPGQEEEPSVIGDQFQATVPLFGTPAQPLIAGGGFPSGRTKQQASQRPTLAVLR